MNIPFAAFAAAVKADKPGDFKISKWYTQGRDTYVEFQSVANASTALMRELHTPEVEAYLSKHYAEVKQDV